MKDGPFHMNHGPLDEDGRPLLTNWAEVRRSLHDGFDSVGDDPASLDYSRLIETMPRLALESADFLLSDADASERRQRLLLDMQVAEYLPEIDAVSSMGVVSAVNERSVSLQRLCGLLNSPGAIRGAHAAIAGDEDELVPASFGPDENTGGSDISRDTRSAASSVNAFAQVPASPHDPARTADDRKNAARNWSKHIISYVLAACLLLGLGLAAGYGGGYQIAHAAASQTIAGLNSRVSELRASLEAVKKRPAMDALQQAERGREYSVQQGNSPTEVVLRLSPFLGLPYYAGLDVDWGDGSAAESLYFAGTKPETDSQLRHEYAVDPGSQQLFNVVLTYYRSGEAMESLRRSGRGDGAQTITKTLSLRVSDAGVFAVSGPDASIVSASIVEPNKDGAIVTEAEPSIRMLLRASEDQHSPTTEGGSERTIHLVVRALDGPVDLRRYSYVQPFTVSVASLIQQPEEQQFDTWVSLPGAGSGDAPTKYELLVVELPVALVQQVIDRRLMNFDDATVRSEVVRSSRVIRYQAASGDAL